eukprot:6194495-Pleurochrysis_carterae.AAC.1
MSQSRSGSSHGGQERKACERQQQRPCIAPVVGNLTALRDVLAGEVAIVGAKVFDGVGFGDAVDDDDIDVV